MYAFIHIHIVFIHKHTHTHTLLFLHTSFSQWKQTFSKVIFAAAKNLPAALLIIIYDSKKSKVSTQQPQKQQWFSAWTAKATALIFDELLERQANCCDFGFLARLLRYFVGNLWHMYLYMYRYMVCVYIIFIYILMYTQALMDNLCTHNRQVELPSR